MYLRKVIRFSAILWCLVIWSASTFAQGFHFLSFPSDPQLAALGGMNISLPSRNVGTSFKNPALLRPTMHGQAAFAVNSLPANIKNLQAVTAYQLPNRRWMMGGGVQYFNYGTIPQTDASGNELGNFRPNEYTVQWSMAAPYEMKWHYGFSLKWVYASYGSFKSYGVAMDAGISYNDSLQGIHMGFVLQNMGKSLKSFDGTTMNEMPFDMQWGISKQLEHAPISLSLQLHHLHQFDIADAYTNTATVLTKESFLKEAFRHMIAGAQIYWGDRIEINTGFNYLRRNELSVGNGGNGLAGFSMGAGWVDQKLQVRFTQTYYQSGVRLYQLGLNLSPFSNE